MRSSGVKRSTASEARTRARVASWEITTPLLLAVVPDVNRMNAGSSSANPPGPGASRSAQWSENPAHTPSDSAPACVPAGTARAAGEASQPFTSTSRATSEASAAVRWLASGVRHAPAASSPNAAGMYARSFCPTSPMRCAGRTPREARNEATRSASRASSA